MFISKIIKKINTIKLDVSSFLLTFSSIVIIRTFFEFILEPTHSFSFFNNLYFSLVDYVHIYFSWLTLFFSVVLFLKFSYDSTFSTLIKTVLVSFPIIIIVPFIDFTFPTGNFIRYEHNFENFLHIFTNIAFFNIDISNLTFGVRVEIILVLMMVTLFGIGTQAKLYKICISVFGAYCIIFLFMYMPAVLSFLVGLDLKSILDNSIFPTKSYVHLYALMYIPLFLIQSSLVIYFLPSNWKKSLWYIVRIERLSIYLGLLMSSIFVSIQNYAHLIDIYNPYDILKILSAIFSLILFFMFSTIINDIEDELSDKISNKNRVLVQKLLSKEEFLSIAKVCFAFSFLFGLLVNEHFVLLLFALYSLSYLYSVPPFRLKKIIFVSHLTLTFVAAIVFLLGYCITDGNLGFQKIDTTLLYTIMLFFFISSQLKDIKDAVSDKKYGVCTLANIFETKKVLNSLNLAITFMLIFGGVILKINIGLTLATAALFFIFAFIYKNSEKSLILLQITGFILLAFYITQGYFK